MEALLTDSIPGALEGSQWEFRASSSRVRVSASLFFKVVVSGIISTPQAVKDVAWALLSRMYTAYRALDTLSKKGFPGFQHVSMDPDGAVLLERHCSLVRMRHSSY